MVDKTETKEEASGGVHGKTTNERKVAQGNKAFKQKGPGSKDENKKYNLLKGVGFTITRYRPDLYLKAVKRLGHYVCTDVPRGRGTYTT